MITAYYLPSIDTLNAKNYCFYNLYKNCIFFIEKITKKLYLVFFCFPAFGIFQFFIFCISFGTLVAHSLMTFVDAFVYVNKEN